MRRQTAFWLAVLTAALEILMSAGFALMQVPGSPSSSLAAPRLVLLFAWENGSALHGAFG